MGIAPIKVLHHHHLPPHPVPSVDFAAILRQWFDMVGELIGVDQSTVSRTLQRVTDALLRREPSVSKDGCVCEIYYVH